MFKILHTFSPQIVCRVWRHFIIIYYYLYYKILLYFTTYRLTYSEVWPKDQIVRWIFVSWKYLIQIHRLPKSHAVKEHCKSISHWLIDWLVYGFRAPAPIAPRPSLIWPFVPQFYITYSEYCMQYHHKIKREEAERKGDGGPHITLYACTLHHLVVRLTDSFMVLT
jgi:hypothetical protein